MNNTIHFGKINLYGTGKRYAVDVQIELKNDKAGRPVFTACAEVWNNVHSDIVMGGQCLDELKMFLGKNPTFKRIYRLWKLYHLNNMHAGTPEQEKLLDDWKAEGNKYDYDKACEVLKDAGLYEVMVDGKPYKYGHSWLYSSIAEEDMSEIKRLLDYRG